MIITICGPAGSGKSSASIELAKRLGYNHYSMGDLRRKMAAERDITIAELNKLGETEDFTDTEVDKFQENLGKTEDNFVVDGRTSWYFIPQSIKIHLDADVDIRAKREIENSKLSEKFQTIEDAKKGVIERDKSDVLRYMKYYDLDVWERSNFDLIIDTTELSVEQTVNKIIKYLKEKRGLKE
jgi:cytidylate kinase